MCQHGPSSCFATLSSVQTRQCLLHDCCMLCCILSDLPSRILLVSSWLIFYFSLLHLWFWHFSYFLVPSPNRNGGKIFILMSIMFIICLRFFSKCDLYLGKLHLQLFFELISSISILWELYMIQIKLNQMLEDNNKNL